MNENSYYFSSIDARDKFFEAGDNSLTLQNGLKMIINDTVSFTIFEWKGKSSPASYDRVNDSVYFQECPQNTGVVG